jgi:hypothetical protein
MTKIILKDHSDEGVVVLGTDSQVFGDEKASVVFNFEVGKKDYQLVFWRDELEKALEILAEEDK